VTGTATADTAIATTGIAVAGIVGTGDEIVIATMVPGADRSFSTRRGQILGSLCGPRPIESRELIRDQTAVMRARLRSAHRPAVLGSNGALSLLLQFASLSMDSSIAQTVALPQDIRKADRVGAADSVHEPAKGPNSTAGVGAGRAARPEMASFGAGRPSAKGRQMPHVHGRCRLPYPG
jgi:hypothetical protein